MRGDAGATLIYFALFSSQVYECNEWVGVASEMRFILARRDSGGTARACISDVVSWI